MLITLVCLLAAAAVAVTAARRAGFGSVLGYLVAGVAIGPAGLRLVTDVRQIADVSSLGVIMLLFLIGLEVRPARLWTMRRAVFGLGLAQVGATGACLAGVLRLVSLPWPAAMVVGVALALSSTAIVLPLLAERDLLGTRAGRDSFAVLLFQDLAFIPLVALVPLLADGAVPTALPWRSVAIGLGAIAAILVGGRFLLPPAFRLIGGARTPEIFSTLALLTVAGTAAIATSAGLSASLGAFLAGVLLSSSAYRHELRADIEPFEGLLLGFFFMSVGMSADLSLLQAAPGTVLLGLAAVLVAKIAVAAALARLGGQPSADTARFALALSQGSEFSFVLLATAVGVGALSAETEHTATLVIALSMIATPLLFAGSERLLIPRLSRAAPPVYDTILGDAPVIIAGVGRVGQVVGRILRLQGIRFTALERDPGQVEVLRRFGSKVFYGDPARVDLLRAAGAETARLLVVAVEPLAESLAVVEVARRHFPHLQLLVRARNRQHVYLLRDRGVDDPIRDTFLSAVHMAARALSAMDVAPAQVRRAIDLFVEHDEKMLRDTYSVYRDEKKLVQTTREAAAELESLFEADRAASEPAPSPARESSSDQPATVS